jgi:hypothetical protein
MFFLLVTWSSLFFGFNRSLWLVELKFDWSEFQFNKIQLKRNSMHIDGKGIESFAREYCAFKKLLKRHKYEKTPFHACYLGTR